MQFTHGLTRRLPVSRGAALATLLAVATACDSSNNPGALDPAADPQGSSAVDPSAVDPSAVNQLVISQSDSGTEVNQKLQLTAEGRSPTGEPVQVEWSATGGTIDSTGTFFAAAPGSYTVYARARDDKNLADSAVIVVSAPGAMAMSALASAAGQSSSMADAFVETISVQTHLGYNNVYQSGWGGIVRPRLLDLGVRHIRERMGTNSTVNSRFKDLASNGIKLTAGCWPVNGNYTNASNCISQANALGPSVIDALDGWNEVDGRAGTNWPTAWVQWQTALWKAYKGNGTWSSKPLYANSLAHVVSTDKLGNRSAILDYGNMHSYPAAQMPSVVSSTWIPKWNQVAAPKGLVATETGYHSCPSCTNGNGVSLQAQAKYMGRLLFEYYNRGVKRTNMYELIDQGVSSTDREQNWGLIKNNGTIKPAFTMVKNIIALLKDPGPGFTPRAFSYALSGALSTTHSTLLQKRDGRSYLVLWQEVRSWDLSRKADVSTPNDLMVLTLGTAARSIKVYRPGQGTNAIQTGSGKTINLSVPDEVIVVEVTP
jgi:hypothetical protein